MERVAAAALVCASLLGAAGTIHNSSAVGRHRTAQTTGFPFAHPCRVIWTHYTQRVGRSTAPSVIRYPTIPEATAGSSCSKNTLVAQRISGPNFVG